VKQTLALVIGVSLTTFAHAGNQGTITQLFAFPCFGGSNNDTCPKGARPDVLIQASDGNLYGAAEVSDDGVSFPQGGALFRLTPAGHFTLLFTFAPEPNGSSPNGNLAASGLVEGNDGFLYGTTALGGANDNGVLFKISKAGLGFEVLHDFCSSVDCADGNGPGGLLLGRDGNIYGVTGQGGSTAGVCCGTIFRFNPITSAFSTLHRLNGTTDGAGPSVLIQGADGNFYGTDEAGDINSNIIRVSTSGQIKVLFTFPELEFSISGLTQASNGNLYGAFSTYGQDQIQFFKINPSGQGFDAFPSFGQLEGVLSIPSLFQASDGNLWDTSFESSSFRNGSVFAISPLDGAVVHTFPFDDSNGSQPLSSVIQGVDGKIYGTAELGGVVSQGFGDGTVWSLDAGLRVPVPSIAAFTPSSGAVDSTVLIRGNNFIGTTAVKFNGVSATFKVLNVNFISATVPAAATTGPISITTAGGTTTSTQHFTIR
jgi:uncharacterized repeat protein (TIGR03803 family)